MTIKQSPEGRAWRIIRGDASSNWQDLEANIGKVWEDVQESKLLPVWHGM